MNCETVPGSTPLSPPGVYGLEKFTNPLPLLAFKSQIVIGVIPEPVRVIEAIVVADPGLFTERPKLEVAA